MYNEKENGIFGETQVVHVFVDIYSLNYTQDDVSSLMWNVVAPYHGKSLSVGFFFF